MPYKIRLAPRNSTVTLGMTRTCTTLTLQFPSSPFFIFYFQFHQFGTVS